MTAAVPKPDQTSDVGGSGPAEPEGSARAPGLVGTPGDALFDQLLSAIRLSEACALIGILPGAAGFVCAGLLRIAGASASFIVFATGILTLCAVFAGVVAFLQGPRSSAIVRRIEAIAERADAFTRDGAGPTVDRTTISGKLAATLVSAFLFCGATRFRVAVAVAFLGSSMVVAGASSTALFGGSYGGLVRPELAAGNAGEWARAGAALWIGGATLALIRLARALLLRLATPAERAPLEAP